VEFVYSTWQRVGDAHLPGGTFRLEDGVTAVARCYGERRLVLSDSAPSLALPPREGPMGMTVAAFLAPTRPDTVRVSATTFLLRNRGFAETVSLVRDTVFVFDATQGEERVRQDSAWIARLFPGPHPIVLVVNERGRFLDNEVRLLDPPQRQSVRGVDESRTAEDDVRVPRCFSFCQHKPRAFDNPLMAELGQTLDRDEEYISLADDPSGCLWFLRGAHDAPPSGGLIDRHLLFRRCPDSGPHLMTTLRRCRLVDDRASPSRRS
jgi:hypothetical protein